MNRFIFRLVRLWNVRMLKVRYYGQCRVYIIKQMENPKYIDPRTGKCKYTEKELTALIKLTPWKQYLYKELHNGLI